MDIRIRVQDDGDDGAASLSAWLVEERAFRGRVQVVSSPIGEEQLGSLPDVVSVALGAGGAGTVLATSLTTWLQTRRSSTKLTVERDGRSVTLEIDTVHDVRPLLEQVLRSDEHS